MADVFHSGAFRRAVETALKTLRSRDPRLFAVVDAAMRASQRPAAALAALRGDVAGLIRMTREFAAGRYRRIPHRTIVAVVAGLIYLADPVDLIPDVLPAIGLVDDAAVLGWVLHLVRRDLDDFLVWEREWGGAIDIDGQPVAEEPAAAPRLAAGGLEEPVP